MKEFIDCFKKNPMLGLMWVVGLIMLFVDEECGAMMLATAGVTPASVDTVPSGSPQASPGQTGLDTQLAGEPTTVSNVQEASDLIEPDIDEQITQIASDESVIDTIKRRVKRVVHVKSFEVDHYVIDEKPATIITNAQASGGTERVTLSFENNGHKLINAYYTAVVKGVNGYEDDGVTESEDELMLLCVGHDTGTGNPIFMAINGTKENPSDEYSKVPAIPAGTELLLCSSMGYETQKFIAPSTVVPVPERMYLQKQLCNRIVSDYFEAQKKRIPFKDALIAEATLRQYRLESCRTAWFGRKGRIKVKAQDPSLGEQFAYSSQGLKRQFKRRDELIPNDDGKLDFNALIDLLQGYFTTYASKKKAIWLMGKHLLSAIQKINFTQHVDITMGPGTSWGIEATKLHTVFGDVNLVHDPTLDRFGCSWQGALIDEDGLVRYVLKDENSKTENVVGEEAKREVVITIDCLCLKGYNHMWVDGSKLDV